VPNRAPEAFGGGGHLDVADAERGEGVDEGVAHRWRRADIAGFTSTLDAEGLVLVGTGLLSQSIADRVSARGIT
jgi:hypothetical protein